MKKLFIAFALSLLIFSTASFALDIPLSGGSQQSGGGAKIGFVDMDRIFKIYPQTQAAKEDYSKQLKKKKDQLAAKEKELEDIKNRISILDSTSVSGAETPGEGTGTLKKDLEDKKVEYEEMKKQASQDLANFQSQQSQIILGKIYQALRDLALEEQVSVVVDKASILYGDATIDLTDKLQERVRGY